MHPEAVAALWTPLRISYSIMALAADDAPSKYVVQSGATDSYGRAVPPTVTATARHKSGVRSR